ncbi:MAG TPA: hypothetical protein PLW45_04510 [Anaerolineaceae bacterium]|nr:hypothetical protein [Anaerolineaceae bacterium]
MNFGFSYVGLIYLVMLTIPNLFWTKNQPKDYEQYASKENKVLVILERVGQVLVCCSALIFSDFNIKAWSNWSWWLVASFVLMLLYEIYWLRYFKSEKTMRDFYGSLLGIPVPGATLPIAAFLLLAVYGKNIVLAVSVLILGIGHIGIHLMHLKAISQQNKHQ